MDSLKEKTLAMRARKIRQIKELLSYIEGEESYANHGISYKKEDYDHLKDVVEDLKEIDEIRFCAKNV